MPSNLIHFLLVEDDDDHAELVSRSLERERIANKVDRVTDGAAALQFLRREGRYADARRPDVVLLDLNLPKLDGHEVLAQVKTDPSLRSIPMVVLSSSDAEVDRAKAYAHHANSYLTKPIDFAQFHKMVKDLSLYWGVWNRPSAAEGGCPPGGTASP